MAPYISDGTAVWASKVMESYETSKAKFDAGDKKSIHWRLLKKEYIAACEITELSGWTPPEPKIITKTVFQRVYINRYWPGVIGGLLIVAAYFLSAVLSG